MKHQVLVVDADPLVRTALSQVLLRAGAQPVVAASAEEALALAEAVALDGVVVEQRMPGMDGVTLLHRLSSTQQDARFLLLSSDETRPAVLPRGHRTRILRKPVDEEEVVRLLLNDARHASSVPPPAPRGGPPLRVLLLEDEMPDALLFRKALELNSFEHTLTHCRTLAEAEEALGGATFDVACLDLQLPDATDLEALYRVQTLAPPLAVVVLSHHRDPDFGVRAIQAGAHDYLVKRQAGGSTLVRAMRYAVERKLAERRVAEMAFFDPLTQLANRTLFRQRIAEAASRSRRDSTRFAVLLLDMDRFKEVNDLHGHDAGDAFLKEVGRRINRGLRVTDTGARLGGDEFAVLLDPVDGPGELEARCSALLRKLAQPVRLAGTEVCSSASIGVALYPDSGLDSDALLQAADGAMYAQKSSGRNGYHYYGPHLHNAASERRSLEDQLRGTVARGEFELYYQRQVTPQGALFGAEALLRWRRRDGQLVPASRFVPLLEETGLISELGDWVARSAMGQLRRWVDEGLELRRMAINVSAHQFRSRNVAREILSAARDLQAEPARIEIELTETALLRDAPGVQQQLVDLAAAGFRIALDDFGTGFSSLTHLCQFPISTVKIDRSFVRAMMHDASSQVVVETIALLGARLGLDVVAEGAETETQVEALRRMGVNLLQGFYFGRPVPASTFEETLRQPAEEISGVRRCSAVESLRAAAGQLRTAGEP